MTNTEIKPNLLVAKCQHVSLEVSNVDISLNFYREFLGMKLTERHPPGENKNIPFEMAFLRFSDRHHDLVLTNDPNRVYSKKLDTVSPAGIHHFAFECPSNESFVMYLERARKLNIEIVRGPVVHSSFDEDGDGTWGENESFYILDPDNHRIEIFCKMASISKSGEYVNSAGVKVPNCLAEEV